MSSEPNSFNLPAWEAALLDEARAPIQHIYENILSRYLFHSRLTADTDPGQVSEFDMNRSEITDRFDKKSKQTILTANYGDFDITIGRYDPVRDNFVTFPELLTLEERYLLHEKRLQYILDKNKDDMQQRFPLIVANERHKQINVLAPFMEEMLDFYNTVDDENENIFADDATGFYICQERKPGAVDVSVALEHAFSIHRRGGQEGIKRHSLTRIPVITCSSLDAIESMHRYEYVRPEAAEAVLRLAQESSRLWDSDVLNRRLDLTFMRYN